MKWCPWFDIKHIYKSSLSERKGFISVKDKINLRYIFIRIFGEIMELYDFTLYVPHASLPHDPIHSPSTSWLNMTPSRHTPEVETAS